MRKVSVTEKKQRGCLYCLNYKKRAGCEFDDGCPYHQLDKVKTYGDYLKKYTSVFDAILMRKWNQIPKGALPNRRCGSCRVLLNQHALIKTKKSPNGWFCSECYEKYKEKENDQRKAD